ncbi:hypothetical protein [Petroclostridium xylanilyticum]|uniref:hypothetical protein n=1 Tax=Petroclostridium xylanilyticum TaxID=1792311 RepID=UPI001FA82806|nr:hypothetical protein [Petroclostridium xylanilyticum]
MENSPARYELIIYDKTMHHHLICLKSTFLRRLCNARFCQLWWRWIRERNGRR